MTGASSRVATLAIASAFAEAMADKSAAEERVENAEPRQICRGSVRETGVERQYAMV